MPGRHTVDLIDPNLCKRCQVHEPAITVRNEALCKACFSKYALTKIIKRMETFRVRHAEVGQERKLLLALSLGAGSMSLLHVLSEHLKGQLQRTGRTGFKLHILNIREDTAMIHGDKHAGVLELVKSRFSEHAFSSLLLSDLFSYEDISSLSGSNTDTASVGVKAVSNMEKMDLLLASVDSATSRADMMQILKRKLIVAFAKTQHCEAILFGDSTTKLAERTLAETAKGRGFSLPWVVTDGHSPFGIPFYYPMRDLLSKEISAFTSITEPPLDDLIVQEETGQAVNIKNTTIDDLMKQYFSSVEKDYPSIVANVVKTAGKLQPPTLDQVEQQCELCEMPLEGQAPERSRLCYGCIRTLPSATG